MLFLGLLVILNCLSFYVGTATDWQPVQSDPSSDPEIVKW